MKHRVTYSSINFMCMNVYMYSSNNTMLIELLHVYSLSLLLYSCIKKKSLFPFICHVLCIKILYVLCRRTSPFKPLGFLLFLLLLKFIFAHVQVVLIVQLFSRINKPSIHFNSIQTITIP